MIQMETQSGKKAPKGSEQSLQLKGYPFGTSRLMDGLEIKGK
jgi:hypothetical protein